ncbi:MAG: hypothetical protein FWH12_02430 [Treponema sp.]|nr:hypothetical protein [Treponema sp.]
MTIKIDSEAAVTRSVSFAGADNLSRVTVEEAITALNAANFPEMAFSKDEKTTRLMGRFTSGSAAEIRVQLANEGTGPVNINAGSYAMTIGTSTFVANVPSILNVPEGDDTVLVFVASTVGVVSGLPANDTPISLSDISPSLPSDLEATVLATTQGVNPAIPGKKIQVLGPLACALDFGQGLRFGGNGLEILSFFDDETISIGLPKDIKDKEEIDLEGAMGTITRMVIGATLQGLSPVITVKEKNYSLLELIQGGSLNRETGTYNPPLSNESETPSFYTEIYSPTYTAGSNTIGDMAAYEKILIRTMTGIEGDVPIEAKAWATYAYNCTATEYTDENNTRFPAWEEQTLSLTEFDGLKVKEITYKG